MLPDDVRDVDSKESLHFDFGYVPLLVPVQFFHRHLLLEVLHQEFGVEGPKLKLGIQSKGLSCLLLIHHNELNGLCIGILAAYPDMISMEAAHWRLGFLDALVKDIRD